MGNTLPKNPTREDYLKYASKASPEKAMEIYLDISRQLKIEKKWEDAIGVLMLCANLQKEDAEKVTYFVDIANLYKKLNSNDKYISHLDQAIALFRNSSSFSNCAKYSVLIAEEYEKNLNYKKAIEYYLKAVDYYEITDMENNRDRYRNKLANLYAFERSTLQEAINIFEALAETSSKNKLTISNIPRHLLHAGLCTLLLDVDMMENKIEKYVACYPIFLSRREYRFLNELTNAVKDENTNAFTAVTVDYDQQSTIDEWTCSMLLNIKKSISENKLC